MKELENEDGIHAKLIAIYESMDRHRYEFDPFIVKSPLTKCFLIYKNAIYM